MSGQKYDIRKTVVILLLIFLSLAIIAIQINAAREDKASIIDSSLSYCFSPFQKFFTRTGEAVSGGWSFLKDFKNMVEENEYLKSENLRLKTRNVELENLARENKHLKGLLDLKEKDELEGIAASVIARDPSNWFRSVTVDKGYDDGIAQNMIVINAGGIVGRVVEVHKSTSVVRLITDQRSAVPSVLMKSQAVGIVYGDGENGLIMKFMTEKGKVEPGETVISSGLGMIFPEGKVIGKVVSLTGANESMFKYAKIKPSVDFSALDYVMVVKKK